MQDNAKKLCQTCETGREMLRLDPREPMCPYLCFHTGDKCMKYVKTAGGEKCE